MGAPDPDAQWWTTTDVAAYLGVALSTVSTYRARGQMPAPDQTVGRTHVWEPKRIITWNESRPGHGGRPIARPTGKQRSGGRAGRER